MTIKLIVKKRLALVGTGTQGINLWGKNLQRNYSDYVGSCDINPQRLAYGKDHIGCDYPTFADFEEMMKMTKLDALIVTTVDSTHHEFIIRGQAIGLDQRAATVGRRSLRRDTSHHQLR
ncbi:MAG: Gfo/Idh/MocA family oxidoreductase [Bacteroidota bacterium]